MTISPSPLPYHRHSQCGFTLVELMVGLAIGLVLIASLALMFANTSHSRGELDKSIRQIENGRYAIELLQDDLEHAGFYGELSTSSLGYAVPDACATALGSLGWDKTNPATPKAPVPIMGLSAAAAAALTCLPNHRAGTPAIALHRLGTDAVAPSAITTTDTAYVQSSRCASDPAASPFVMSAASADFTLQTFKCDTKNIVRPYVSRIYYLADCNECSLDTVPTLKMAELRGTAMTVVPLAEGIEDIELQYGFDTTGVGAADKFAAGLSGTAGASDNLWANVVAVRLYLLSRTTERSPGFDDGGKQYDIGRSALVGPYTDQYKRRVYTTTIRLPNVAGPREGNTPSAPASSASPPPASP